MALEPGSPLAETEVQLDAVVEGQRALAIEIQ
jgi:hypothetical protein